MVRLVVVPGAGSGAGYFRDWDSALPGWVELRAVAAPGREHRIGEAAPEVLEAHVHGIIGGLEPLESLPLALLGHSMGAIVAWEVARRLHSGSTPAPRILFLSGMLPPGVPRPWDRLSTLPDAALLAELRDRFAGFPPELDRYPDLRSLMLETVRRDLAALESHRPASFGDLGLPIRVLAGRHDRAAPPEQLRGWASATRGKTRMAVFEGGHDFIVTQSGPVAKQVAADLRSVLGAGGNARI